MKFAYIWGSCALFTLGVIFGYGYAHRDLLDLEKSRFRALQNRVRDDTIGYCETTNRDAQVHGLSAPYPNVKKCALNEARRKYWKDTLFRDTERYNIAMDLIQKYEQESGDGKTR